MATRHKTLVDGGFPYLVAVIGGRIDGYAYAGPYRPRVAYRFTVEDSVYVRPDAQGHGIGRLLLSTLIGQAEARGFRQMIAVIGDSAQQASIELHRSLGFTAGRHLHQHWLQARPLAGFGADATRFGRGRGDAAVGV